MLTRDQVIEALRTIRDPELDLNIVDLGLVYKVDVMLGGALIQVDMTLTSPMCLFGPQLVEDVREKVMRLDGVVNVDINLVWRPRWDPAEHASEEARAHFGIL